MNDNDIKQAIKAELQRVLDKAIELYGCRFEMPPTDFTQSGNTAGKIHYKVSQRDNITHTHTFNFNMQIARANYDLFISRTPGHEMAHYISLVVHGYRDGRGHGYAWKNTMRALGFSPDRCHNYDMTNVAVRKETRHEYACNCSRTLMFSATRHNRQRKSNNKTYSCTKCNAFFKPVTVAVPAVADFTEKAADTARKPATKQQGSSKADTSLAIVQANFTSGRGHCIELIMSECNMTKAGAGTYYQNAKKKLGL